MARRFAVHATISTTRAPLNSALCAVIARERSLSMLLAHAPENQRLPVLLLAAIHFLVLAEPDHELARWYPNITPEPRDSSDPALAGALHDFVDERAATVLDLLATRRVQTNEIGRCTLLLAGFDAIGPGVGPLAQVDVGTSAGLTTLLGQYRYRYDDGPVIGRSGPLLACSTRGARATPASMPVLAHARGIDVDPIDVTDSDDVRWLEACCWPDQTDRFKRLVEALEIAGQDPPTIVVGDAVDLVAETISDVAADEHPVVTTTWAINYLDGERRRDFVERLDATGAERDLSWVFAESPALTPELPHAPALADEHTTALTVVRWRDGARSVEHLANCHPHGYWLHWLEP